MPSVELITLHTDQVLFPLLAVTVAALTFTAFTRASLGLAFGAGVAASLAMFCSFPLGLGALLGIFAGLGARSTEWKVAAKIALFVLLGAVVADRIFAWCLGYDFMLRYERSVAHHVAWRGWNGRLIEYVHYALLGLGEFGLWLGVPVTLLAASQVGGLRSTRDAASFFATGLGLVLLALAVFGKTKGEVARLWLFLVPFACAAAANALSRFSSEPRYRAVVGAVFALEAAVLLATKRFQDFW